VIAGLTAAVSKNPIEPRIPRYASVDRRSVLLGGAGALVTLAAPAAQSASRQIPIIDTHIHLFDPNRPQGAPYFGPPNSATSKSGAFPDIYRRLTERLGVVGALEVEASPWMEDNLWVLEVCAKHDIMVGMVGNLRPDAPEFAEYLERYHKNAMFRGIRYGNLWNYNLVEQVRNPAFMDGLKLLAQADLVLESANPQVDLLEAIVRVSDTVPELRIVVDHLPSLEPTAEMAARYAAVLLELQQRPNIYCKLSEVIHRVEGKVNLALADYRPRLDHLSEIFGADRVLFGSDWPNSDSVASVESIVGIMREYFSTKPLAAAQKYFWMNSVRAYKWIKRAANQPTLS
jgi:L-fuconolactonase